MCVRERESTGGVVSTKGRRLRREPFSRKRQVGGGSGTGSNDEWSVHPPSHIGCRFSSPNPS